MRRYSAYDTTPRDVGQDFNHSRHQSSDDDTTSMLLPFTPLPGYEASRSPNLTSGYPTPQNTYRVASQLHYTPDSHGRTQDECNLYRERLARTDPGLLQYERQDASKCGYHAETRESMVSIRGPSKQYHRNLRHIRESWMPGIWHNMPWKEFGALLSILLLTGMSTTLIFMSNRKSPSQFHIGRDPVSPHIYLSLLELLIILSTLYALQGGLVIYFWVNLIRGTTLAAIHDSHNATSFPSCISKILHGTLNKPAIATLITISCMARGPISQRALILTPSTTYQTSLPFAITAVILSVLPIIAIVPLYFDFWILGRHVSLNPLEIARAFGAPLLEGVDGNASAVDIEMQKGSLRVRYGAVERYGGEKMLRVEDRGLCSVRLPREEEIFG